MVESRIAPTPTPVRPVADRRPAFLVHYLWHGFTLCMKTGAPQDWPDDHRWVSGHDDRLVTCPTCQDELAQRRARTAR